MREAKILLRSIYAENCYRVLNDKEFVTYMKKVEAILNCQPLTALSAEIGSIEIHVSAIRIARYFCIDIGITLATFRSIVYRYRLTHILRIADTCIANTNFTVT